ncbi:hypothetical protein QQF64_027000 [Cirrhinus molitorella]|uniref:Uncharacterized protein n=1 Tax=Cirrhinus molitorella TaxID=172907 RepID=A0ABR3NBG9_9TELE
MQRCTAGFAEQTVALFPIGEGHWAWRCKGTSLTTEWASFEHHYGGITTKKSGLTFANGLSDHDIQNSGCVIWMKNI